MTDHAPMTRSTQSSPFTARCAESADNTPADIHKTDHSTRFSQTLYLHLFPMFESVNGVSIGMTLKNTLQLKGGGQG